MMGPQGPRVVEFNARFGDPETQAVVPRMDFDLAAAMSACADGNLGNAGPLKWKAEASASVVLASGGYPGGYKTGLPIHGLDKANALPGVTVFHAGTQAAGKSVLTAGGRVLSVTALGADLEQAVAHAYEAVKKIQFDGMHFRKDIGARALVR